ncbi:hypothetical protein JCM10135_09940 [Stetteria hydrogenophila]
MQRNQRGDEETAGSRLKPATPRAMTLSGGAELPHPLGGLRVSLMAVGGQRYNGFTGIEQARL